MSLIGEERIKGSSGKLRGGGGSFEWTLRVGRVSAAAAQTGVFGAEEKA